MLVGVPAPSRNSFEYAEGCEGIAGEEIESPAASLPSIAATSLAWGVGDSVSLSRSGAAIAGAAGLVASGIGKLCRFAKLFSLNPGRLALFRSIETLVDERSLACESVE